MAIAIQTELMTLTLNGAEMPCESISYGKDAPQILPSAAPRASSANRHERRRAAALARRNKRLA